MRRTVLVLVGVLGLPAVAPAGPIDFTYSVTVVRNPLQYDPGPLTFALDSGGNVHCPAGGTVELGRVTFGPSPGPQAPGGYTAYAGFRVEVLVTDQWTGEAGRLTIFGAGTDQWDDPSGVGRWEHPAHFLQLGGVFSGGWATDEAVVAGTNYTLATRPEDGQTAGVFTLTAAPAVPEPVTLVLGALAVLPAGLRAAARAPGATRPARNPRPRGLDGSPPA